MAHDLVIRGGNIVDGTGAEPVPGDVAIDDGLITAVGEVAGKGTQEIDAEGHVVSPGFIDLHTHLDAQIGWDPALTPVSWHGVTTALMGNCGVTFAPCKPADRELLAGVMETVEDIPKHAIMTGLPWTWEHYGGYLDALEDLKPGINVAGLVGHCAVRYYVMGERAVEEQSTDAERQQMAEIVGEAIDAGATGFSTNRYAPHKLPDGRSIPGTFADPQELVEIAKAVAPRNALMQAVGADFEVLKAIADTSRGRILFSYGAGPDQGQGRAAADRLDEICDGRDITAITHVRGSGFMFGLQSILPFRGETWDAVRKLDLAGRLAAIDDADTTAKLIEEGKSSKFRFDWKQVFFLGNGETPDYTVPADDNVDAMGKAAGEHFVDAAAAADDVHAVEVETLVRCIVAVAQLEQQGAVDARGDALDALAEAVDLEAGAGLVVAPATATQGLGPRLRCELLAVFDRSCVAHGFLELRPVLVSAGHASIASCRVAFDELAHLACHRALRRLLQSRRTYCRCLQDQQGTLRRTVSSEPRAGLYFPQGAVR